jgi:hypothetical protein
MRRTLLAGLLLLVGCQGIEGPFARSRREDRIDDPRLSIAEQYQRGRDRLALPERSPAIGPRTYAEEPALWGGR